MTPERMIDLSQLDELARRLSTLVPPGLREGREELQQNFKSVLQSGLARLDLVTREEFDVQRAVLLRTREKLEALEAHAASMELHTLRLDTNRCLVEARALYLRNGYREIAPYNNNPYADHWFQKDGITCLTRRTA